MGGAPHERQKSVGIPSQKKILRMGGQRPIPRVGYGGAQPLHQRQKSTGIPSEKKVLGMGGRRPTGSGGFGGAKPPQWKMHKKVKKYDRAKLSMENPLKNN